MRDLNDSAKVIIATKPHPKAWLPVLFLPVATFVFVAITVGIMQSLGMAFAHHAFVWAWVAVTLVILIWSALRDPELLTWTLTTQDLRRGKRTPKVMLRFQEIESIVIGMPVRLPWYIKLAAFHPFAHYAYQNLERVRESTLLVRLSGRRYMPLNFLTGQFVNGQELMRAFISLNESKIVGKKTYTKDEERMLAKTRPNALSQ
jgi:hypothetical protein